MENDNRGDCGRVRERARFATHIYGWFDWECHGLPIANYCKIGIRNTRPSDERLMLKRKNAVHDLGANAKGPATNTERRPHFLMYRHTSNTSPLHIITNSKCNYKYNQNIIF